jgi:hypothetical protein
LRVRPRPPGSGKPLQLKPRAPILVRRGSRESNAPSPEPGIEERIPAFCLEHPTWGTSRVASELRLSELNLSVTRFRGVWLRHGLETRFNRLLRLDAIAHETAIALNEDHVRLLERHGSEFRDRRIKSSCPGDLSSQDTFCFCGCTPEGVGKVYEQVAVSAFCSAAFASIYTPTMPITACDPLCERVLPFCAKRGAEVGAVITDYGRDFCGRPEQHPYELVLAVKGIARLPAFA